MPWEWTCSVIPCHTRTEWHSSSHQHHWYNTVIEILVEDSTILENNALRVNMLCGTMSHTHRMAQFKPPTSLIQHCDWDTCRGFCRGHYDPREQCLESEQWTCSVVPCHTCTEWHSSSHQHHWYNTVIETLVEDTTILKNNALRVDMLCDTMSHTHRMAQLKPTTSLIQHCD